ncbi:MAG: ascorbate-dependent monooxygenase, partial [Candidatus Acidiferrum sp.]
MKLGPPTLSGFLILLALGTAGFAGRQARTARPLEAHSVAQQDRVTFNRDIAPIIFRNCSQCHHPGESGPFSLLTYSDVKSHGRQIAYMTNKRIMPPWLPDPDGPKFAGELRLTDEQIASIQKWVDEGEIEGKPADLPPQPKFAAGWDLGPPDLVVRA